MAQQKASKKTPLYTWHLKNGANMLAFGEYEMPLWYPEGAKQEHLSVITHAGLFDTSHMTVVFVSGPDAFDLLQFCFTRDLKRCIGKNHSPLKPGTCVYGVFLNDTGATIDDAILYQIESNNYMIVVNSGMGEVITRHLNQYKGSRYVTVTDLTDRIGKIDIQGPMSAKILLNILKDAEKILNDMDYFTFKGTMDGSGRLGSEVIMLDNIAAFISRTGYTGEFGFEILTSLDTVQLIWETIIAVGKDAGLIPCGLAARDSLRTGALLPLSHQDIGSWLFFNNPWMFALPFNKDKTDFTKNFIGSNALLLAQHGDNTYPFVGSDLRKISTCHPAVVLDNNDKVIGQVLTCVSDMAIGKQDNQIFSVASRHKPDDFEPKGLSCGFIKVNKQLTYGQTVRLKDNRRTIEVMVVKDIRPDRTARCVITDML